jgi:hypothetical protein
MGAIKPWHILLLLCCLVSVTAIVAGVVAIVLTANKRKQ